MKKKTSKNFKLNFKIYLITYKNIINNKTMFVKNLKIAMQVVIFYILRIHLYSIKLCTNYYL